MPGRSVQRGDADVENVGRANRLKPGFFGGPVHHTKLGRWSHGPDVLAEKLMSCLPRTMGDNNSTCGLGREPKHIRGTTSARHGRVFARPLPVRSLARGAAGHVRAHPPDESISGQACGLGSCWGSSWQNTSRLSSGNSKERCRHFMVNMERHAHEDRGKQRRCETRMTLPIRRVN